ncbi:MAG: HEPN domain-containing protein [Chitinophagales bacterium]
MSIKRENYLAAARDSVKAANVLLTNDLFSASINRSYYAIFYCVQCLVATENEEVIKTHSGLKTRFNQLFVKTGKVEKELAEKYNQLFLERMAADYDIDVTMPKEEALESLEFANTFLAFTENYFKN